MKYVDPDGRKYGFTREAQKKIQERAINNSISYDVYNHIQKCKQGPVEYPVKKLTQKVNGRVKFGTACIYFSAINACLMSGLTPDGYIPPDLSTFVDNTRGVYTSLIQTVFGVNVIYHDIPIGLNEKELKEKIGMNPAVLIFEQSDFWGNTALEGVHGIAYFNGEFHEPFTGRQGCDFNKIKSPVASSDYAVENYLRGFYFEVINDEK